MIHYGYLSHADLAKRVFFNEPASPPHIVPRAGHVHPCPPELKWTAPIPRTPKK
jgi:hypothetical protein